MELSQVTIALFFILALARVEHSTGQVLKGSVACLDCNHGYDLSGILVVAKCDKVKEFAAAYTEEDGTFETKLPSNNPLNCISKIMGGPYQLYTSSKNYVTVASKSHETGHFTTSKPLNFYVSCPLNTKCRASDMDLGASKTVDLPLPREWGLAPSSYYIYPFLPIIGIP